MKFGIDIGHNVKFDSGAAGIKKEDELNKKVGLEVIKKLKDKGYTVVNCTPKNAVSLYSSLYQRVLIANTARVNVYVSIHFNAGGGTGTEVYAVSQNGREIASKISNSIAKLGYKNRGVKDGGHLFVLKNTNMPAVLVECCFVDSKDDMDMLNIDKMAQAIVDGLIGPSEPEKKEEAYKINILELQKSLNSLKITDASENKLDEDGILGPKTIQAVEKLQTVLKQVTNKK